MASPGRNSPCPCGSGEKYKRCCWKVADGRQAGTTAEQHAAPVRRLPPEVIGLIEARARQEADRKDTYGDVRPIIHTDFQGHKFVAVGNELHYSKAWKTFPDFLFAYIKKVLGSEWGNRELEKDPEDQHPIVQWYGSLCRLQARSKEEQEHTGEGIYESELDGPSKAYLLLAYDLYVLRDNRRLQDEVVRRLKHPDQFQGARYELFVAATMIRAGFEIDYEDETDVTRKHPEFRGIHNKTDEAVVVEAKSRHLPGVLGRPTGQERTASFQVAIRRLIERALAKPVRLPYIVFVDANLPPELASPLSLNDWQSDILEAAQQADPGTTASGLVVGSTFNMLVVTNAADHYGDEGSPPPRYLFYWLRPLTPARPLKHPEVFDAIERALEQYGNVPNDFPEELNVEDLRRESR